MQNEASTFLLLCFQTTNWMQYLSLSSATSSVYWDLRRD